ncbi:hypothetical protein H2203_004495 [Taxawa tesnikishii (nom. ined.)]|nr:hypothetical protein H2203_004495 [Dothideales sp. JES 119]
MSEVKLTTLDPLTNTTSCIGYARTQGRRCRNAIARENATKANALLQRLPARDDTIVYQRALATLARLCLCRRWHQDQADDVARQWYRETSRASRQAPAVQPPAQITTTTTGTATPIVGTAAADESASLRWRCQTLSNQLSQADGRTTEQNSRIAALQSELSQERRRVTNQTRRINVLQSDLDDVREQEQEQRAQMVDLIQISETARRTADDLRTKVDSVQASNADLEKSKADLGKIIHRLQNEVSELNHTASGSQTALEATQAQLNAQLKTSDSLRKDLKSANNVIGTLKNHESALESRDEALRKQKDAPSLALHAESALQTHRTAWDGYLADWRNLDGMPERRSDKAHADHITESHPPVKPDRKSLVNVIRNRISGGSGSCSDVPASEDAQDNTSREHISWPTRSGRVQEVSSASVETFFLNSIPGLVGGDGVAAFKYALHLLGDEERRWQLDSISQRFGSLGADTRRAVMRVIEAVQTLRISVEQQVGKMSG